jgi:predicted CoA-substrate-specific enzyme activase
MYAGIDIGSLSAEAVLLNRKGVLAHSILPTGADSAKVARRVLNSVLDQTGVRFEDLKKVVATGFGRVVVPFAQRHITELSCHARGAHTLFPSVRTVLDIGGQDCKVLRCDEAGKLVHFVMNDRCAAGTGRYLEMVSRALGIPLEQMGALSLEADDPVKISSRCVVFAKSEVLSLNRKGAAKADILAGVHEAIADRVMSIVARLGVENDFIMTGGVAKNVGVVRAIEKKTGSVIHLPEEPQIIGALGAAAFAAEENAE